MYNNYRKIISWMFALGAVALGLFYVAASVSANNNTNGSCTGSVCVTVNDDLPVGATILNPNTTVNLNFAVIDSSNPGNDNPCPSGKSIYHVLKHASAADGSNYDYRSVASGNTLAYSFGSGNAAQVNNYTGIFYCDTGPVGSASTALINTMLGRVNPIWTVNFSKTTTTSTTGGSTPSVLFSPSQGPFTAGGQIKISVQNLPSDVKWYGMYVNTVSQQFTGQIGTTVPYPLNLTTAENIKTDGSTNTVEIKAFDASGNQISLQNDTLTFTVQVGAGSLANGTACTDSPECKSNYCEDQGDGTLKCNSCPNTDACNTNGDSGFTCTNGICVKPGAGSTPGTTVHDCTGPNPDPNYCLYNPLPTNSLLATLLLIMQNFLIFIGAWAAAFIVIGGFKLIMSQGNEEAVTSAKKTITWAIVGFAVAILSFSIMAIIQNILQTKIQNVSTKTSSIQTSWKVA